MRFFDRWGERLLLLMLAGVILWLWVGIVGGR